MSGLTMLLNGACCAAMLTSAAAQDVIYDSKGFESFNEGQLGENDQDGWRGNSFEGGANPWVWVGPPSQGAKSIALRVFPFEGAASLLYLDFPDLIAQGYTRVTISFDVYRTGQANQWFDTLWWLWDNNGTPMGGLQTDTDAPMTLRTYPLTGSFSPDDQDMWTDTPIDQWATVELTWDFQTNRASGSYNGVLISEKQIAKITSLTEWYYIFQHRGPEYGPYEDAWIDNFIITGEKAGCYPDCDGNGALDLFDFLCFVNDFTGEGDYANCDENGQLDLFDFLCFVNAFNGGC